MSVIDWNKKEEPWRSMGLEFVKELAGHARVATARSKRSYSPYTTKWTPFQMRCMVRARDVDNKRWKEIASEFSSTPAACIMAYRRYLAANPVLR